MDRRHLIGSGVVGGLAGLFSDRAEAGEAAQSRGGADTRELVAAIEEIRDTLRAQQQFGEIAAVRDALQQFLRTNGKLPDLVEVSLERWFAVYDWHIKWQQPLTLGRDANGRYTVLLMQTAVILRTDTLPGFVGIPYDLRA